MSRLLLDTTFLIDVERSAEALDDLIADDDDVAMSAITVAEFRAGALLGERHRRASRRAYLDEVVSTIPVIDYGVDVAEIYAKLLA